MHACCAFPSSIATISMKKLGNTIDDAAALFDWLSSVLMSSAVTLICAYDLISLAAVAKMGA